MRTEQNLRTMMANRGADWRPGEDVSARLHRAIATRRRTRIGAAAAAGTVGIAAVSGVALTLGAPPAGVAPAGHDALGRLRPAPAGYHLAATGTGKLPGARLTLMVTPTGQVLVDNSCDTEPPMQMQIFVDAAAEPAVTVRCGPAQSTAAPFGVLPLDPAKVPAGRKVVLTATFRAIPAATDASRPVAVAGSHPPPTAHSDQARLSVYVKD